MEDELNGRWHQWKIATMEDDLKWRRPERKTISKGDNLKGRQPQGDTNSKREDLNGRRRPQWRTTLMEDGLNGRRPQLKNCWPFLPKKTIFCSPQLVSFFAVHYCLCHATLFVSLLFHHLPLKSFLVWFLNCDENTFVLSHLTMSWCYLKKYILFIHNFFMSWDSSVIYAYWY